MNHSCVHLCTLHWYKKNSTLLTLVVHTFSKNIFTKKMPIRHQWAFQFLQVTTAFLLRVINIACQHLNVNTFLIYFQNILEILLLTALFALIFHEPVFLNGNVHRQRYETFL